MPESHASPEQFAGWLPEGQHADTAPLGRDGSQVNWADSTAVSGYATRPGLEPSHPPYAQPPPAYGYGPPPQGGYPRPSQQQLQGPYATNAAPPVPTPQPPRPRVTPMGWVARGLILCAISVVSGLIWAAIKPHTPAHNATPSPVPHTKYHFNLVARDEGAQNCQTMSTYEIAHFFQQHQCQHITRALYTTSLPGGQKVLTSVITILMPDPTTANQLYEMDKQNVGTVKALEPPTSGAVKYPALEDRTFEDQQQGSLVVIGDSSYFNRATQPYKDPALVDITTDALQLGWPQDGTPPR